MDILREKADDGLAKEIFGAGYDYECDEEYDGQQQLLKKYGYFYFVENGKLGLADKSGHTIIEPEYSRIEISENGQYLKVVQNGLNGIMTIAGEEVIPMVYSEILPLDWNNYGKGLAYDFLALMIHLFFSLKKKGLGLLIIRETCLLMSNMSISGGVIRL